MSRSFYYQEASHPYDEIYCDEFLKGARGSFLMFQNSIYSSGLIHLFSIEKMKTDSVNKSGCEIGKNYGGWLWQKGLALKSYDNSLSLPLFVSHFPAFYSAFQFLCLICLPYIILICLPQTFHVGQRAQCEKNCAQKILTFR
jgi:hypothetical protein